MNYPIPSRVPLPTFRPDREQLAMTPGAASQPQRRGLLDFAAQNPEFFLSMGAGLLGGRTGPEQWSGGLSAAAQTLGAAKERKAEEKRRNATLDWLKQNAPEYVGAVEAGALSVSDAYKMKVQAQTPKKPDFMNVGGQLYNPDTGEWIAPPKSENAQPKYGMSPVYLQNPDGSVSVGQLSDQGVLNPAQLPEGYQVLSPYERSRQTAQGSAEGKVAGESAATAAGDIAAADQALDILDQIETNPALERGTGFSSLGNVVRGTAGYDFQNLVDQAKSGAFLQAVQQMRGLGALSNAEGSAATAAITRMDTATSKEAFLRALSDYRSLIEAGKQRALARAQGAGAPAAPRQGRTSSGITFTIEE